MASSRDRSPDATTFQHRRYAPSPPVERSFAISCVEGPDRGAQFLVTGTPPRVLVGKSPACDFRLSDPEVSRRHIALEIVGGRLRVIDLESSNGTWLDQVAIADAFATGGETLRIGQGHFMIAVAASSAPQPPPLLDRFGTVVGISSEMRRIYGLCQKLAASNVPTIIEGETGTGKELLAEAIHQEGPRASGPFVVFDCTAVPANLVESELFGHERGAFTGAVRERKGVFEQAHGGTLLIDEIGDLDAALQPKLLRAIERSEIHPVGGDHWIRVDVRLLAATRRDLDREVQENRFRDDLLHRLAVGRVELPPLRRRRADIPLLVERFATQLGASPRSIPTQVMARWEAYEWPGNVRQLRNAVARFVALGDASLQPSREESGGVGGGPGIGTTDGDLVEEILDRKLPLLRAREILVEEFRRRYIERVLAEHGGNVTKAAAASGIALRYFQVLRARTK